MNLWYSNLYRYTTFEQRTEWLEWMHKILAVVWDKSINGKFIYVSNQSLMTIEVIQDNLPKSIFYLRSGDKVVIEPVKVPGTILIVMKKDYI